MGDRRFVDRDGRRWEVRVVSKREWRFEPVEDNPGPGRVSEGPGYERDPFELSTEELERLLTAAAPVQRKQTKSPFLD